MDCELPSYSRCFGRVVPRFRFALNTRFAELERPNLRVYVPNGFDYNV
jgi:hypothetical protein